MRRRLLKISLTVLLSLAALLGAGYWYRQAPPSVRQMRRAMRDGHWAEALAHAKRRMAEAPGDREAALTAARALCHLKRWLEADRYFRQAGEELSEDDIWLWAEALAKLSRWDEGLEILIKLFEREPNNPRLLRQMAVFASESGRNKAALKLAERLARFPQHRAVAYAFMGSVYLNQYQYGRAARCLAKALELDPSGKTLPQSVRKLNRTIAWCWLQMGEPERAKRYLAAAWDPEARDPVVAWMLGEVCAGMNDPKGAYAWWVEALRYDPTNPDALFSIGRLELERGNFEAAVDWLSLAARRAPKRSEPLQALATAYMRLGMRQRARLCQQKADRVREQQRLEHDSERVARVAPQSAAGLRARARQALKAGQFEQAVAFLEQAVRRYNDPDARAALKTLREGGKRLPTLTPPSLAESAR